MRKKIFSFILVLLMVLPCAFIFSGCGENFIEERTYKLLGMTVITDNTPNGGGYVHYDKGEFAENLTGGMSFDKCTIDVGRKECVLVFNDTETTGVKAEYKFTVYTDSSVYPAYSFTSFSLTIGGSDANGLTDEQVAALDAEVRDIYEDVMQFKYVCENADVSVQLVTQNKSFSCHIVMLDKTTADLLFMGMIYGY